MPKKVLLVDDAAMFLEIQKDFLKMSSISVLCAKDGLEALEKTRILRPDLLVMDLHMPRMTGAECCAAIKADPALSSIPVIMATSAGKDDDHEICRKAGCDGLLTKPFDRGLFLDAIRRFIPELDRRDARIPFTSAIRFQAFRVAMTGTILDLSARGIFVASEYDLDVGTEIVLTFALAEANGSLPHSGKRSGAVEKFHCEKNQGRVSTGVWTRVYRDCRRISFRFQALPGQKPT